MRKLLRWRTLGFVVIAAVLLAFPFGPLFPWSPLKPGYAVQHFTHADVVYPRGTELPEPYRHVDDYVERAQRFQRLPAPSRISVVLCRNWNDFRRFMPTVGRVGGATVVTGTVVYITPRLAERGLEHGEFIRHELSHAVLNQNQSMLNAWRGSRQQWFVEGLAVSFGEQKTYFTPEEFLAGAREQELGPMIDPDQRAAAPQPFNMRFAYQTWRYFLEHLVETRGRERFQQFMTTYLAHPGEYRVRFAQIYGVALPQAIQEFQEDLRAHGWKPDADFVSMHLQ